MQNKSNVHPFVSIDAVVANLDKINSNWRESLSKKDIENIVNNAIQKAISGLAKTSDIPNVSGCATKQELMALQNASNQNQFARKTDIPTANSLQAALKSHFVEKHEFAQMADAINTLSQNTPVIFTFDNSRYSIPQNQLPKYQSYAIQAMNYLRNDGKLGASETKWLGKECTVTDTNGNKNAIDAQQYLDWFSTLTKAM